MTTVLPSSRAIALTITITLLASLGLPLDTYGQISADRPGFGTGTATVGSGTVQASLGYAGNGNGITSHELGQLLLRYGVSDRFELRGGINSYVVIEAPFDNGYSGTSVGAKVRLFKNDISALSGVATLGLPTETGALSGPDDRARQDLVLAYDGALGDGLTLSVNGGTSFYYASGIQNDRDVEVLFIPTLSFGLAESVGAYVGYAGFYDDGPTRSWVEGGITMLSNANTQLDVNTGLRVDDNGDGFFVGAGVAHRF